jgi:hypothetical protein
MSDLIDLIGVLGGIDEYLVERPELVPEVSELLRPYQYGALGWFGEFREWVDERAELQGLESPEIPGLDESLERLGGSEGVDGDEIAPDLGLRLLALTVLGRTMNDYGPDGDHAGLVVDALAVAGIAGDDSDPARLFSLLIDSDRFPDERSWEHMLSTARDEGLLDAAAVQPLRCRGKVVEVTLAGKPHPATAVTTQLVDRHLSYDDATAFLDPGEWPNCCPAWCAMTRAKDVGDGVERYEEKIGIRCPDALLTTCLAFKRVASSDNRTAVLAYRLSAPPNPNDCGSDGEVLVDEGSIEVRDRHPLPGIAVTTTKRVLFKSVPPGPLAMFSCVLGYADLGDLLVYECARLHPHKPKALKPKRFTAPPTAPTAGSGGGSGDVFADAAVAARKCVADAATGYRESMKKIAAGEYTSEDAMSDMARMWKRGAADVATAVELGVRASGMTRSDDASDRTSGAGS